MNEKQYECPLPNWEELNQFKKEDLEDQIHRVMKAIFEYDDEHPYVSNWFIVDSFVCKKRVDESKVVRNSKVLLEISVGSVVV